MIVSSRPAAIITGGSSGIGAACARAFVARGMDVAIAARGPQRLADVAASLSHDGGRVLALSADVTDEVAMRTLVSRTLAAFGRLDVLVCSAGLGFQGSTEETTPEVLDRLLRVNVVGTFNAVRAVLPYLEAQRAGHLIVIASIVGKRAIPGYAAYSASKFAQTGLAEALRAELRHTGVAVTTVFPVSARTRFREAMRREFGVHVEGGGPSQPVDEIARAVVRALATRAPEVYPLGRARALAWANTMFPRVADRLALRFARRRRLDAADADTPSDSADR